MCLRLCLLRLLLAKCITIVQRSVIDIDFCKLHVSYECGPVMMLPFCETAVYVAE
jgi:hypothetical protein